MEEKEEEEEGGGIRGKSPDGSPSSSFSSSPQAPPPPLLLPPTQPFIPQEKKWKKKEDGAKDVSSPLFIIQDEEEVNPGRLILSLLLHPPTPFPKVRKNILQKRKKAREMKKNFVSSMVPCNCLKFEDSTVP